MTKQMTFVVIGGKDLLRNTICQSLTLKGPITTAADDKFCDIFPNQQMILMKYHALLVIFEKAAKFEIVLCCKL